MGIIIGIVGIIIAILSLLYARTANKIAKRAPAVSAHFFNKETGGELNKLFLKKTDLKFEGKYSEYIPFPLVFYNHGRLTAKNILVIIRYPPSLRIHTGGKYIEQFPKKEIDWFTVEHKFPDLPPNSSGVLEGDRIAIPLSLFEGVPVEKKATTKDGVDVKAKIIVHYQILVECIVYAEDALPTFNKIIIGKEKK